MRGVGWGERIGGEGRWILLESGRSGMSWAFVEMANLIDLMGIGLGFSRLGGYAYAVVIHHG